MLGQTQISYSQDGVVPGCTTSSVIFNHPLDLHFAAAGLQVLNFGLLREWFLKHPQFHSFRYDFHLGNYLAFMTIVSYDRVGVLHELPYNRIGWTGMDDDY